MSEVLVVFHKSTICAFTKKQFDLEARKYLSFRGDEIIVLFVYWHNSTRCYCSYYYFYYSYYTTDLLLLLPLQFYNLLLMALEIAFWVQLSRYNSKSINNNTTTT